jgi:DNA-binding transcriptional MerR regulator
MLIGDLARLSNVTPATIRFYEELGLLTQPRRSEAGYRHYCETAIEELRFIRRGRVSGSRSRKSGRF